MSVFDAGDVRFGSRVEIPFNTADKNGGRIGPSGDFDPADIFIYFLDELVEHNNSAIEDVVTNWDGKTGNHLLVIDLGGDTEAFFVRHRSYRVMLYPDTETVDGEAVSKWIGVFSIENRPSIDRMLLVETTIFVLSTQTSFTIAAGSQDADAYNNCMIIVEDKVTGTQKAVAYISDYAVTTRGVTLKYDPGIFTMGNGDHVYIYARTGQEEVDLTRINGQTQPVDALEDQFDGTGLTGPTDPARQDQVNNIGSGATGGTHVEAIYDNTTRDTIDNAAAVDKGSGLVGIPVTGHTFVTGREVTIAGTTNYNGAFEVVSQTTNEVVITDTYVGETFAGSETIVSSIKGQIFVGTVTSGTFADTSKENGVLHSMDDVGDDIDVIYGFNIGGSRQASVVAIFANVDGNTDQMILSAYNFADSQWETDGNAVLPGSGGSTFVPLNPELVSRNTGTGVEIGDVFVRIHTVATTPSSLDVDKCLLTAVGTNVLIGYPNGYEISAAGVSGTEFGVNGTAGNPCPFADALVMNAVNPLNLFTIQNGETVILDANSDGLSFVGETWTLALGGQSIVNLHVRGATVSGTSTGSGSDFRDCNMGTCTIAPTDIIGCRFTSNTDGGFTMQTAGDYLFDRCSSRVAGDASPVHTFPGAGNTFVNDRAGSGGRQYEGMTAGDVATVEGWGQFIEGTCPGGAVTIRGCLTTSGITNIALTDDARFTRSEVASRTLDEINTGATHNVTNSFGRQVRELDEQMGYQDGAVWIDTVNGTAGSVVGENGRVNNPVDNITDAIAIAVANGNVRMHVASGSTITLLAALENYEIFNANWALILNGQSVSGSCIHGASVTGIATGASPPKFMDCSFGAVTLPPSTLKRCGIGVDGGTFTAGSAGEYVFAGCYSLVPGSGTPSIVMSGLGSATGINNRGWLGGSNYTLDGDCTLSHEVVAGGGQTITTGGAAVELRGIFRSANIVLGTGTSETVQIVGVMGPVTITGSPTAATVNVYGTTSFVTPSLAGATINNGSAGGGLIALGGMSTAMKAEVNAEADTALADYDGPTNAEMIARTLLAASYFDPANDTVVNVTNLETYTGNTKQTGNTFALADGASGFVAIKSETANILALSSIIDGNVGEVKNVTDGQKADGSGLTAIPRTGYKLASDGLDSIVIETGLNARQAISVIASSSSGILSGAATTTITIAAAGVPATNRITATVDANGNRSAVNLTPPA